MATFPCSFCKGDHTDVKCPHLDGYINHMLAVIKSNVNVVYTTEDVHSDPYTMAHRFDRVATATQHLNFQRYTWYSIAYAYSKKMNYKAAGLKRRGKKRKKAITCGYCGHKGHTRRTCAIMNKHIDTIEQVSEVFRNEFLNACKTHGIGIGSIVKLDLSERGQEYKSYWGDLPDTMMAMITRLPVQELNMFINEPPCANHSLQANFGLKFIAPTGRDSGLSTYDAPIDNVMFNSAFSSFCNSRTHNGIPTQYDLTIIGKSTNLTYDKTINNPCLEFFKKHDEYTMGRYVGQAAEWLKERSST